MISNRKTQHIYHAEAQYHETRSTGLEQMRFVHHSLSTVNIEDVILKSKLGPFDLDTPFFINAMTGGSDQAGQINEQLALLAKETNLAMAIGSASIALKQPDWEDSFKIVRKKNPNGIIFSNIGAHHSLENAKRAIDLVEANALQVHLNIPQEIVMPEGDRHFSNWLNNIEQMVQHLEVPIIVKEVGFGMSQETIQQLLNVGVSIIDIAGKGGTNFIQIENERRDKKEYNYLYDWGQSTAESMLEAQAFLNQADFIASGGIKTPLDVLKCLGLGASAVGMSGEFLHMILSQSMEETVDSVNSWKSELKNMMALIGAPCTSDIRNKPFTLSPDLVNWMSQRKITLHK